MNVRHEPNNFEFGFVGENLRYPKKQLNRAPHNPRLTNQVERLQAGHLPKHRDERPSPLQPNVIASLYVKTTQNYYNNDLNLRK